MKKYRLSVGLDVDDVLYDCNAYALAKLNEMHGYDPPLSVYDIKAWGQNGGPDDERLRFFGDPAFAAEQPLLPGAAEFVRELSRVADVFFVTAVPPACMTARALRLAADFPYVPADHILIGAHKDLVELDILLDDGAHNIESTPATYPVLFRRPWNTHLSGLLSVNTYDDFLHLVKMVRHAFVAEKPDLREGGALCLVGPTGSRKNEIARALSAREGFVKPVTATTRPRRAGEGKGDYRFISERQFIREAEAGAFLETTVYGGYRYGTTAEDLDDIINRQKAVAVIPIDVCGALSLKNRYRKRALLVFLHRGKAEVVYDIVSRDLEPAEKTGRILSLSAEYRNEELCDLTVEADDESAADRIAAACGR